MEMNRYQNAANIPPWKRYTLTIQEAADYYHIGVKRLYHMAEENPNAEFIVMVGKKVLLKRELFEDFLNDASCI